MNRKVIAATVATALMIAVPLAQAQAHDHRGDGVALGVLGAAVIGGLAIAAASAPPQPVYVQPQPVYVAPPPPPVYVMPAPVYVQPQPVYYVPPPGYYRPYHPYRHW